MKFKIELVSGNRIWPTKIWPKALIQIAVQNFDDIITSKVDEQKQQRPFFFGGGGRFLIFRIRLPWAECLWGSSARFLRENNLLSTLICVLFFFFVEFYYGNCQNEVFDWIQTLVPEGVEISNLNALKTNLDCSKLHDHLGTTFVNSIIRSGNLIFFSKLIRP